jgi:hypothetical protein
MAAPRKPARNTGTMKPLKIMVHPSLLDSKEVQRLIELKHEVVTMPKDIQGCDLVLSPNCWRMTPELIAYVKHAIDASRAVKYPKRAPRKEALENDDE